MGIEIQKGLEDRLKDQEFAEEYGENIAKAEIAVAVAQARRSKNLTQEELANTLGKSQSYVAKLESGDANPTIGNLGRILANIGLRITANFCSLLSSIENKEISYESTNSNENVLFWDLISESEILNENTTREIYMFESRRTHYGRLLVTGQADEIGVTSPKGSTVIDKDPGFVWRYIE